MVPLMYQNRGNGKRDSYRYTGVMEAFSTLAKSNTFQIRT